MTKNKFRSIAVQDDLNVKVSGKTKTLYLAFKGAIDTSVVCAYRMIAPKGYSVVGQQGMEV